jgi:hypothetical protein
MDDTIVRLAEELLNYVTDIGDEAYSIERCHDLLPYIIGHRGQEGSWGPTANRMIAMAAAYGNIITSGSLRPFLDRQKMALHPLNHHYKSYNDAVGAITAAMARARFYLGIDYQGYDVSLPQELVVHCVDQLMRKSRAPTAARIIAKSMLHQPWIVVGARQMRNGSYELMLLKLVRGLLSGNNATNFAGSSILAGLITTVEKRMRLSHDDIEWFVNGDDGAVFFDSDYKTALAFFAELMKLSGQLGLKLHPTKTLLSDSVTDWAQRIITTAGATYPYCRALSKLWFPEYRDDLSTLEHIFRRMAIADNLYTHVFFGRFLDQLNLTEEEKAVALRSGYYAERLRTGASTGFSSQLVNSGRYEVSTVESRKLARHIHD